MTRSTAVLIRQGDVLLIPSSHPAFITPTGKRTPIPAVNGRLMLAYGEVTGHHHSVPATVATLDLDEAGLTYLTIAQLTEVKHQEHLPAPLLPDVYRVVRQRELSCVDAMPRQVQD